MARSTREWIAKHDDAAIPPRVQLRIWERANGHCQICTRKIMAGETKHFDHIVPLADGGEHRETNLQVACVACHKDKTSEEAAERSKVRGKAKSVYGFKAPKQKIPGRGFGLSEHKAKRLSRTTQSLPPKRLFAQAEEMD
ncbi:HNH endonuclease signature motif containing protein [Mesorhizobium sp. Z1-4]|uniref:HNH endonuclease n=1 Tax=Mesorhizobium sp. Z1-4 TaxID=2448478 RepID=UPI000FD800C2|nr:HNH endonuclease signature motif containing protein [Mesorhizobium sp. Z1-4]